MLFVLVLLCFVDYCLWWVRLLQRVVILGGLCVCDFGLVCVDYCLVVIVFVVLLGLELVLRLRSVCGDYLLAMIVSAVFWLL